MTHIGARGESAGVGVTPGAAVGRARASEGSGCGALAPGASWLRRWLARSRGRHAAISPAGAEGGHRQRRRPRPGSAWPAWGTPEPRASARGPRRRLPAAPPRPAARPGCDPPQRTPARPARPQPLARLLCSFQVSPKLAGPTRGYPDLRAARQRLEAARARAPRPAVWPRAPRPFSPPEKGTARGPDEETGPAALFTVYGSLCLLCGYGTS